MYKNDLERLRNEIGNLPIMADRYITDDNIAIALATYFENLPECPENDINDQTGWSQWAIDKTNDVLDRIIAKLSIIHALIMDGDKVNRCTCERCTGINLESYYDE